MPLKYLFSNEKPVENPEDLSSSDRALMDDLHLESKEEQSVNIFTGEEELFASDRTKSRLSEMQTSDYWKLWEKHR